MCGTYSTCKNVGCPLVIVASARLEVRCQQCVGASSVDPQLVKHGVTVCLEVAACQYNPWCVWKLCEGSEGNLRD